MRFETGLIEDPQRGRVGIVRLRVRYAETDRMGIVYNAHYLTWFEVGRTEFMRALGTPYRVIEERGYNLPMVEAHLRIRQPLRYDDLLVVLTWLGRLRSRVVEFRYEIRDQAERVVATGSTTHASVESSSGKTVVVPDWLRDLLLG